MDQNIDIDTCIEICRSRVAYGQGPLDVLDDLKDRFSPEIIFLAYKAAELLKKQRIIDDKASYMEETMGLLEAHKEASRIVKAYHWCDRFWNAMEKILADKIKRQES